MVSKKIFSNVILFFLKYLLVGAYNPGPMSKDIEDIVLDQKVVVAVTVEILFCMGGFPVY